MTGQQIETKKINDTPKIKESVKLPDSWGKWFKEVGKIKGEGKELQDKLAAARESLQSKVKNELPDILANSLFKEVIKKHAPEGTKKEVIDAMTNVLKARFISGLPETIHKDEGYTFYTNLIHNGKIKFEVDEKTGEISCKEDGFDSKKLEGYSITAMLETNETATAKKEELSDDIATTLTTKTKSKPAEMPEGENLNNKGGKEKFLAEINEYNPEPAAKKIIAKPTENPKVAKAIAKGQQLGSEAIAAATEKPATKPKKQEQQPTPTPQGNAITDAITLATKALHSETLGAQKDKAKEALEETLSENNKARSEIIRKSRKYQEQYEDLAKKGYPIKDSVAKNPDKWADFTGQREAIENMLKEPPFSLSTQEGIALGKRLIKKCSNFETAMQEIFAVTNGFEKFRQNPRFKDQVEEILAYNKNAFNNAKEFISAFKKANTTKTETGATMFTEILYPSFNLLKSMTQLKYDKYQAESNKKSVEEIKKENLPDYQKGLFSLCEYKSREPQNIIEGLKSWKEGKLVMEDLNGKTLRVDKGLFSEVEPEAAFLRMLNEKWDKNVDDRPLYKFEYGEKVIDKDVLLARVNYMIQLGFVAQNMENLMKENLTKEEFEFQVSKFQNDLEVDLKTPTALRRYSVANLEELADIKQNPGALAGFGEKGYKDFKKCEDILRKFQMGYLIATAAKASQQKREGELALQETTSELAKGNPGVYMTLEGIKTQMPDLTNEELGKIEQEIVALGGAEFKYNKDTGEISLNKLGALTGGRIKISDRISLLIGVGGTTDREVTGGVALNFELYNADSDKKIVQSVDLMVGLEGYYNQEDGIGGGIGVASGQKLNFGQFIQLKQKEAVGLHWSWDDTIPTAGVGGASVLAWNVDTQLKRSLDKKYNDSQFSQLFEEWKTIDRNDIEARYQKLKEIAPIWDKIEAYEKFYGFTPDDMVNIVEALQDQIKKDTFENLNNSPIPIISGVGVAYGWAGVPFLVPVVEIKFGSAKLVKLNRKAGDELLEARVQGLSEAAIRDALEKAENSNENIKFIEAFGTEIMTKDGKGILKPESNIDVKLDQLQDFDKLNDELEETAEVSMEKITNNKLKLSLLNTKHRDVKVIIDSGIKNLKLVADGNDFILIGDINDFTISRQRIIYPGLLRKNGPTIEDTIVITNSETRMGQRTVNYVVKNAKEIAIKRHDDKSFRIVEGIGHHSAGNQDNLVSSPGYLSNSGNSSVKQALNTFAESVGGIDSLANPEEIKKRKLALTQRENAMNTIREEEFESQGVRTDLYSKLDEMFPKIKDKVDGLKTVTDDPEKIKDLIIENSAEAGLENIGEEGHEKELNMAVAYMTHTWFTKFAKESPEEYEKNKEKYNKVLSGRLERNINFAKNRVLLPAFKDVIANTPGFKPTQSAEDMVEKLINDVYGGLRKKLQDPTYDFATEKLEDIPLRGMMFSASRKIENNGKYEAIFAKIPTLTESSQLSSIPKAKELVHKIGFLDGTTKKYDLAKGTTEDKELARVLLEIVSPTPKLTKAHWTQDVEFLKSPLAMKVASLATEAFTAEDLSEYYALTKVYENLKNGNAEIVNTPQFQPIIQKFKEHVYKIRELQISGQKFITKLHGSDIDVEMNFSTEIVAGAYSKCTNASFEVGQFAEIRFKQFQEAIGTYTDSVVDLDSKDVKKFYDILATAGGKVAEEKKSKTTTEKRKGSTGRKPENLKSKKNKIP